MHVTVVTAFPELFEGVLSTSILGRAVKEGLVEADVLDLRQFGKGGYRQIDDYAFGGGGMVLAAPQLEAALDDVRARSAIEPFVVSTSPQGALLTQEIVETLALQRHVVIFCGHYEGMDERFVERDVDLEVSIGDCVLTGGEIPAMAIIDAMARLVPGVVSSGEAVVEDSFYRGMLDHPHYTRPACWDGIEVPDILLSGDEAEILEWRRGKAVERTLARRPDLLARASIRGHIGGGVYAAILSEGPPDEGTLCALPSLCRAYGMGRPSLIVTAPERRRTRVLPPTVAEDALRPKAFGSVARAREWIAGHEKGKRPLAVEVLSRPQEGALHWLEAKRRCLTHRGPLLFLFPYGEAQMPCEEDTVRMWISWDTGAPTLIARMAIALDRALGGR